MTHDPADDLRQWLRRRTVAGPGSAAPLVVVSGGKANVGTSTIAANLAVALARHGRRTVLVDADLDHGGPTQFSRQEQEGSVVDVLAGRRGIHEVLVRGPSGIQVLPGQSPGEQPTSFAAAAYPRFIAQLHGLSPHADVVLIDAGSGRGTLARAVWQAARVALLITTPDDLAVMQAYAALKALCDPGRSVLVQAIINRADEAAAADVCSRLDEAGRRFLGVPIHGGPAVPACGGGGERLVVFPARSESAKAVDRAADCLWAELQNGLPGGAMPAPNAARRA